ncbi:hypothetical protein TWF225_010805 [Orbilia oligospora]|nr:hypothetical protein TWF225_010805 [Orbilia oligospora]KAF3243172.1 hypothetical protein TWF217_011324 [Orbilia oligospora]KAF3268524.1 hypothetical protein TWF128_006924 [Orbilia oligospora]
MKICCLHSSDEGIEAGEEDPEDIWQDPGLFTNQHTFENKYIVKATAKAQIDGAIAEGYDFYLVFMWGTRDDAIAGFEAIKYFESLNLPSAGVRSFERARDKFDFFADAKRLGNLPIPGDEKFPLFVKPAADYASKLIDENSLVRNEAELEATINRLHPRMRAQRLRRAEALGEKDPEQYVKSLEKAGRDARDLVIQEFIDGDEFSVVVLAMGYVPVALTPLVVKYGKKQNEAEQFLTFEVKYHEDSGYGLLDEEKDPDLYKELQAVAVKAFEETGAQPSYMGCEVDFRVRRSDKKPLIIEVDPMPVWFFPTGSRYEDLDVQHDFPGGHRAVLNTFITNYYLDHPKQKIREKSANDGGENLWHTSDIPKDITSCQYSGKVLDLECRGVAIPQRLEDSEFIGVNGSEETIGLCKQSGRYGDLIHKEIVPFLAHYNQRVDHILLLSETQSLSVEELDFVLARCFQLANHSITVFAPEKTDAASNIKSFGEPRNWRLTYNKAFTTHSLKASTTITAFRFERTAKPVQFMAEARD